MAILVPPHDRRRCARCLELRAEELMAPVDAGTEPPDELMAERYHPRRHLDLVSGRVVIDPDADRETLWGEPPA